MSSLDFGEDSLLGFITFDGEEMLAEPINDETQENAQTVFYHQPFFKEAIEKESSSGFEYVEYNSQSYLFTYSKVGKTSCSYLFTCPKINNNRDKHLKSRILR